MIEDIIISNLIHNEKFLRNVLPYIKEEYFGAKPYKILLNVIVEHFEKYNTISNKSIIDIELSNKNINQVDYDECNEILSRVIVSEDQDYDWLIAKTEKFCQDKAIYNAIMESIQVLDGNSKKDRGSLPVILQDALSVSFDVHIGHDFLEDFEERYDFYHKVVEKIEFDIDYFNKITRGGIPRKTLNVILAGTGVGKTLMMCHFAASNLMMGKNVLYITLEMAEERIAERIDANLMKVRVDELEELPKDSYQTKVDKLREKTSGKLVIKEYPTATVGSGHFRHLMNELKAKKKFVPDIIYVDYLNLCISSRIKAGNAANTYTYVKAIAEELRGLAVEFNLPIFTATQTNRTGYVSSDIGLEDTSESFGLPATADFMIAAMTSEELEDLGQIMVKQLKNRYGDPATNRRFVVGIDKSRMRLYNVEQSAPVDDGPVMDNTSFGEGLKKEKFDKSVFDNWK